MTAGFIEVFDRCIQDAEDDKAKLIKMTEDIQLTYHGHGTAALLWLSTQRYPRLFVLSWSWWVTVTAVTPEIKNRTVATLKELGRN